MGHTRTPARLLKGEVVSAGRKTFYLDLKENHLGRFLKITEDVAGNRDNIVIPISAGPALEEALARLINYDERQA